MCKSLEEKEKKLIKGKRYLFLCGEENLDDDKREELDKMLQMNQPLQEAYLLKEKLRLFPIPTDIGSNRRNELDDFTYST